MEVKLWRAIRSHRSTYRDYITEQDLIASETPQSNNRRVDEMVSRINTNVRSAMGTSNYNVNNDNDINDYDINDNINNNNVPNVLNSHPINVNTISSNSGSSNVNATLPASRINGIVPEIIVGGVSQPNSNCNSFDSAATSSDDYDSCNGGTDERMESI